MTLHNYRSLLKSIDKYHGALGTFLAIRPRPMQLSRMGCVVDAKSSVRSGVSELAARTARCYQDFSNPIIARALCRPNAERLKWVQTNSLREFEYCVALSDVMGETPRTASRTSASQRAEEGGSALQSSARAAASPAPAEVCGSGAFALSQDGSTSAISATCFVRNTDDRSYVDDETASHVLPTDGGSAAPPGVEPPCSPKIVPSSMPTAHVAPEPSAGRSAFGPSSAVKMSREEAELALEAGRVTLEELPQELLLEVLRPVDSVLDILVNEATFGSEQLNHWFSRFCHQRVAWRVLHEHLLYVTRPDLYTPVVCADTDVAGLLETARCTVLDIFSKLNSGGVHPDITVVEDASILHIVPGRTLVTSSVDCVTRERRSLSEEAILSLPTAVPPPPSPAVFSVEGHLAYVFRELLKNACVATARWAPGQPIAARFAADERWVVIDFVDRARGIAPAHMRNIWKFGWTTSEHYESHLSGFGVGLPTSKVYMDMWGGSIDVYSTVDEGTTVRVRFPKSPTEVLVPDPAVAAG